MSALLAQAKAELTLAARQGESALISLGIPVLALVAFSLVPVINTHTHPPVDFLAPGVLALAIMSSAMVSLGIATGFERYYGVLKRLGSTPLGRPRLIWAKIISVLAIEAVQVVALVLVALALGWHPHLDIAAAVLAVLLATAAFAGIGLWMAGALPAFVTLTGANLVWFVLLLFGGMLFPLSDLPGALATVARLLPSAALSEALVDSLGRGVPVPLGAWAVLAAWAVAAPLAAAASFRWES